MKYTQQISKIGTGLFILIPSKIRDSLDLWEKDIVEVELNKVKQSENPESFKCNSCEYKFYSSLIPPELNCPVCESFNITTR